MSNERSSTGLIKKRHLCLLIGLLVAAGLLLPGGTVSARVPIPEADTQPPAQETVPTSGWWDDVAALQGQSKGHPKLDSSLNQLLETYRRDGLDQAKAFASTHELKLDDSLVQVVIEGTGETTGPLREAVEALGGEYQTDYKALLQAMVPIPALDALAERVDVKLVREPQRPLPVAPVGAGTVDTEGLGPSNASAWHTAGYDGSGVRIAVIDAGFTDYASLLGTDLPSSVNTHDWTGEGMGGSEHGTACAEIVHDMAPGATMDLHKVDTKVEWGNAVDQAITDGADIISMSLGWLLDGPADGTGMMADLVSDARSNGIFYATAAGNEAEFMWSGAYNNYDGAHLWATDQNVNYFGPGDGQAYVIPSGTPIIVGLHWDDWTDVKQDYDLLLLYHTGSSWQLVASSENDQAGSYPTPEEAIAVSAPYEGPYGVVVVRTSATRDVCLRMMTWAAPLDERVPQRSLGFPADAPDAITVGAVDVSTYDLEPYSSQGPTFGPGGACSGGTTKPDIASYANVSTVSYGADGFSGTSAAAPHVAGAAALVKEAYPGYSVTQVQNYLENNAVDLGHLGKDTLYGSGRLYLGDPPLQERNTISIGTVTAEPDTSGAFDIECNNADAIGAAELAFTYDSTIGLDVTNVSPTLRTVEWTVDYTLDTSIPSAVEVDIVLTSTTGITLAPGSGVIVAVAYDVASDASGSSPLDITQVNLEDASGAPLPATGQDGTFEVETGGLVYLPLVMSQYPPPPAEWVTILSENFEGTFPGSTWDVFDNDPDSGRYYWGKRNCRPRSGSYSAWSAGDGDTTLSCGSDYRNDMFAWMVYGPFSLADATAAELTFDWWSDTEYGHDAFLWLASMNGADFYGTIATGDYSSWTTGEVFDLSDVPDWGSLLGEDQVWIAFVFGSDGSITDDGSFVDNVLLRKQIGGTAAAGTAPTAIRRILKPNQAMESIALHLDQEDFQTAWKEAH